MGRLLVLVAIVAVGGGMFTVLHGQSSDQQYTSQKAIPLQPAVRPTNGPIVTPIQQPEKKPSPKPAVPAQPVAPARPSVPDQPIAPPSPTRVVELYDFWAPSCSICSGMKPTISALEQSGARVVKWNADDGDAGSNLADKMNVNSLPTYIVLENGVEKKRMVGRQSLAELQESMGRIPRSAVAAKGQNGWRLRLLYPEGDEASERLAKEFNSPTPLGEFGDRYGFSAISTKDPMFSYWYDYGLKNLDRPVLILVNSRGNIVMQEYVRAMGQDYSVILATLQSATNVRSNVSKPTWRAPANEQWNRVGGPQSHEGGGSTDGRRHIGRGR
jgi:thioredoxin 1